MITIPEKRKKPLMILLATFVLIGLLINILIISSFIKERKHDIESYEENIEWAKDDEVWLHYAARDKASVSELNGLIPFAVLCVLVYLCIIFLHRFLPLFLVIPTADLVRIGIMYFRDGITMHTGKEFFQTAIPALLLILILICVTIGTKKLVPAIIAVIVAAAYSAFAMFTYDFAIIYGNQFGNALLLMLVVIFARQPKPKQAVAAPIPAATAQYAFCANCGNVLDSDSRFCKHCGMPVPAVPEVRTAAMPAAPMAGSFLSYNGFFVDEKVTAYGNEKAFSVYDENGYILGYVKEGISSGAKAARAALGRGISNLQSIEYSVTTAQGEPVFFITKQGINPAQIFDKNGVFLASLVRGNLVDANGQKFASAKMGFGMERKLSVIDLNGVELGFVSKKWNGFVRTVFTNADKYYISLTPGTSDFLRIQVIAAALIYEMILGNR